MPLKPLIDRAFQANSPEKTDWTASSASLGVKNARGLPVKFVLPAEIAPSALGFEQRISEMGEVETRPDSWHDAFHACAWLTFPRAKAQINARHVADGLATSANRRSLLRNQLTLIDEGGVLIPCSAPHLHQLIRDFQWHTLFWTERARIGREIEFIVFGHALYERLLNLHHGSIGRGVLIEVAPDYFSKTLPERLAHLDARLSAILEGESLAPDLLHPLPVKGIPGWAAENEDERYYFDTTQFRTGRVKDAREIANA